MLPRQHTAEPTNWPALGLIAALHVALLWGLLQIEGVRQAVVSMAPIMVSLLSAPPKVIEPPKPPPKPKPQMIATPAPTPSVMEAPPMEAVPPPPAAEPVAPLPITPPNFVAAYLDNPPPEYPAASRKLREAGRVLLRVWVSEAGRANQVELDTSSGFPRLDQAAIEAVRRWRFVPARQGDTPVPASVKVPITFELKKG
jgi:periplasmic protein TonB